MVSKIVVESIEFVGPKWARTQRIEIPSNEGVKIGKDRKNHLVVTEALTKSPPSREHCTITVERENLFLQDHSTNGTAILRLNGTNRSLIEIKGRKEPIFMTDFIFLGDGMSGNIYRVQFVH
ncbi:FHA domain-containing protein [archaeon]|nr:FHA domain-containing protein [archaeon]MBT4397352.1 FHA domain-containing protein [archaeon]MBT4440732.1 FHA domain-containing protein [archaeon]